MSNKISIEQKKGIKRNMLLLSLVFVVIGVVLILSSSDFDMRIIGVIVSVFGAFVFSYFKWSAFKG